MAARAIILGLAAGALAQSSSAPLASSASAASSSGASAAASASASAAGNSTAAGNGTLVAYAEVTGNGIDGLMQFTYLPGQGTRVEGTISGLPINSTLAAAGNATTFPWHVHTNALNSSHSCASALGHLDPLYVTDGVACDPTFAYLCQEGDMSGKHGRINTTDGTYQFSFVDPYLRWYPQPFSLLGRSVVIHSPNTTRLACGSILSPVDGTSDESGSATGQGSNYQTAYASVGPVPPKTTVTPFVGSSTVSSVLAMIPSPYSLPAVSNGDIIALTTTVIPSTVINSTTYSNYIRPTAYVVSGSSFSYGPSNTALPSAANIQYAPASAGTNSVAFTASSAGASGSAGVSSAMSSGAGIGYDNTFSSLIGYAMAAVAAVAGGAVFVLA